MRRFGAKCVHVGQDRDKSQALVNMVRNLQVPQNLGISQVPKQMLAFPKGLSSTEIGKEGKVVPLLN
jgi:hypothetical protein